MADIERLRETLGTPELDWLVERLRRRFERGEPATGVVVLATPRPEQRAAIGRFLGKPPSRSSKLNVAVQEVEDLLRHAQICSSLAEAVELLTGPVRDRRAERTELQSRWAALFTAAAEEIGSRPELQAWLEAVRSTGGLRRYGIDRGETLLAQALKVIARLPTPGTSLAQLAATALGDAHALDPNTALGGLVIRAAAALGNVERWDDVEGRRDAWAVAGVLCDELSAPVLTLNLRPDPATMTGKAICFYATVGEPCFLTIRQLLRAPPVFSPGLLGPVVFVCENPMVVAAAANELRESSAPLVCTEGQPTAAVHVLLRQLTASGARLVYHGDFDWAGIQIANLMIRRHNTVPWRMSVRDYEEVATGSLALEGSPVVASWEPELTKSMMRVGRAVHEEQVIEFLLQDLRSSSSRSAIQAKSAPAS